jgi:predicted dienelactone hydrolase
VYKAGHRRCQWYDAARNRPVSVDLWYPSHDSREERPIDYGLGRGSAIASASIAESDALFPLAVLSHGASGSAANYSWLAEYLCRSGVVVLGVSHYGESWVYGAESIDPEAVTRLWLRPPDCSYAISELLKADEIAGRVQGDRIAAVGHSSGGATVAALGGAVFDPAALRAYCRSDASKLDLGCQYGRGDAVPAPAPHVASPSQRDPRVVALVMLDPAAGPGFSADTLARVQLPALVVGSVDNDFLPFEHHAGRYAALIPDAELIRLDAGEGHFVYLDSCSSELAANGVPLCADRSGVDRERVHARLAPRILDFLRSALLDR